MDKLSITGGRPLRGTVSVSGSKNAALPIVIATLLTDGTCEIDRVPSLVDIETTCKLLEHMGVEIDRDERAGKLSARARDVGHADAPYDLVRKMRASCLVLGPLVARFGRAKVSLPGGCAIGARPINFHLTGLEHLGAKIELEGGYVLATAKKLKGNRVPLEFPSVGATENLLMAAVLAEGETLLENCAKEPEISDLARFLRSMGARIEGDGTESIRVQGVSSLKGCRHSVMGDRIEAGTFLAAALATGGDVTVLGIDPAHVESVLAKFEDAGAAVERGRDRVRLASRGRPRATDITTQPFPGFPTDMQAQLMAVLVVADGASVITETIFENRFMHIPELCRLGADITVRGNSALVRGVERLKGAPLMATDLRASASLVIGGLAAEGETIVSRIYHLDRGYEAMESKLETLGAAVRRIKG